jgi:acetyl esterase/lipase
MKNRRDFLKASAALLAASASPKIGALENESAGEGGAAAADVLATLSAAEFAAYQARRRATLWSLLGDLPRHEPGPPPAKLVKREQHQGFTLERLVLDLNGIEPVPALLLIAQNRQPRAPGLLFIHWHGGMYDLGKEMILKGVDAQPSYASECARLGLVTLAIDSWCFGERKRVEPGRVGEEDAFKLMLWRGQVLYGMMMYDEVRALDYLASRPEVDPSRLGATGMSMGATKAWWLAALDPRVKLTIDLCCLTDFDELIRTEFLRGHGIYYYVPNLLKHFSTAQINELIVPRPHLSLNGRQDPLTPPAGVEKVRDHLLPLYRRFGREADCRVELFDCGHVELPEMRALVLEWLETRLA